MERNSLNNFLFKNLVEFLHWVLIAFKFKIIFTLEVLLQGI